jgi:hypothetical protein
LATYYAREARKCSKGKAYFAATIMQVSAFEAALQAMCFLYPEPVKKTTVYQKKRFRTKRNKALEFKLHELINIAAEASWFPAKRFRYSGKMTDLAEISHQVRELRNHIHAGKWARIDPAALKFNKATYDLVCEVFEVATGWLLHHVHQSMLKHIDRREKRGLPI